MTSQDLLILQASDKAKDKKITGFKTMKKFNQLFLTILALLSTALFLFYKHEYNRLYSVLEVLQTFGDSKAKPCTIQPTYKDTHKYQPLPVWQKNGPVYTFSAFVSYSDYKITKVAILALVNKTSPRIDACEVWLDREKKPLTGKLSLKLLSRETHQHSFVATVLECEISNSNSIPYAVSLFINSKLSYDRIIIDIAQTPRLQSVPKKNSVHACVFPSEEPYDNPLTFAEFLVLHQAIGITHFYFYEISMSLAVRKFFEMVNMHTPNTVTVIPWKIPLEISNFKEQTDIIFMNDCILHHNHASEYVLFTQENKYLIPRHHLTIQDIIKDVTEISHSFVIYYNFNYRIFCLEYADDPHATASRIPLTLLQKTRWRNANFLFDHKVQLINRRVVSDYLLNPQDLTHTNNSKYILPEDVVTVNCYMNCEKNSIVQTNQTNNHDDVAFKFQKALIDSEIINFAFSLSGIY